MEVVYKSVSLLANSVKLPGFILSLVVLLDKTIVSSKIYQSTVIFSFGHFIYLPVMLLNICCSKSSSILSHSFETD